MKFEDNLRALRLSRMLNQGHLADALHISRSTYSQYETGARRPDVDMLYAIAKFYDIKVDMLFGREGNRVVNEADLHIAMREDEKKLIDIFERLTSYSKGKLIERAESLEQEEIEKFTSQE